MASDRVVLLPVDGSPLAKEALDYALKNGHIVAGKDALIVLHARDVHRVLKHDQGAVSAQVHASQSYEHDAEESKKILAEFEKIVLDEDSALMEKARFVSKEVKEVKSGIIEVAEAEGASLIVLAHHHESFLEALKPSNIVSGIKDYKEHGSHGKGIFKHYFTGGVSSYVIDKSPIPVLVYKTKPAAKEEPKEEH